MRCARAAHALLSLATIEAFALSPRAMPRGPAALPRAAPCLAALPAELALTAAIRGRHAGVSERPSAAAALPALRNTYFALRHAQSEANLEQIISSDPEVGCRIHGLTELGRSQASGASAALRSALPRERLERMIVLSSPFTRARETAEVALAGLVAEGAVGAAPPMRLDSRLRERWFGDLDGTTLVPGESTYTLVWPVDWLDAQNVARGVESVDAVCDRVRGLLLELEAAHEGRDILLVSHVRPLACLSPRAAEPHTPPLPSRRRTRCRSCRPTRRARTRAASRSSASPTPS